MFTVHISFFFEILLKSSAHFAILVVFVYFFDIDPWLSGGFVLGYIFWGGTHSAFIGLKTFPFVSILLGVSYPVKDAGFCHFFSASIKMIILFFLYSIHMVYCIN